jgi:hypothetical protein
MKRAAILMAAVALVPFAAYAGVPEAKISGNYVEVRSCDVYTGPCFANGEMGLTGKEAMMVWSVDSGSWNGVDLSGTEVIAVVMANDTLGDLSFEPRSGDAVLVVDEAATAEQQKALTEFARAMTGGLIANVAVIHVVPIDVSVGQCEQQGCAKITAGDDIAITTRCLHSGDDICTTEEVFYPPLTDVDGANPAFTEEARFDAEGLNARWDMAGKRSAFLATFAH